MSQRQEQKDWTILVIDDEKDLVELLAYHLGRKGFKIVTAQDGWEGWQKISNFLPDLVILDLMMPNLNGWELCRLIRGSEDKVIREIPILMLTAKAMPEDRVCGLQLGADDYLIKPFSMPELILRVDKLLQKRRIVNQLAMEVDILRSTWERKEMNLRNLFHDLKSPLLSISFIAKRGLSPKNKENLQELNALLKMIYENSLVLGEWINEKLFALDLESGKEKIPKKQVDIAQVIGETINLFEELRRKKEITIEVKISSPLPRIFCVESLIRRGLANIIDNALKYTPRQGMIEIHIKAFLNEKNKGFLKISVRDNGIGIHADDLPKIFDPFCRGKNVSDQEGIGLGLKFVKKVIEFHGGKLFVQSKVNLGSNFLIYLPFAEDKLDAET